MFACFRRGRCNPSPRPSPNRPNLPANMLRYIAQTASPKTRRALSRATTTPYTRRTMPIGLQVTKVGAPIVSIVRPPMVNRSRTTAKTPKIKTGTDPIDRVVPQAYKNNRWQYYSYVSRHVVLFLNTPKGGLYTFNKHGHRVNVSPAFLAKHRLRDNLGPAHLKLRLRRKNFHTWDAYQKRIMNFRGLKGSTLPRVLAGINTKVQRFVNGDRHALDDVPYSQLVMWANLTNWMSTNGSPYVKNSRNGKWHNHASGEPLTKNMIMKNIIFSYKLSLAST
jgi:hypothetical protein